MNDRMGRSPAIWALLAALMTLAGQALTVQANYHGNWTGLFRTGATMSLPENLQRSTLRNPHPQGYDGQFYRLLAHDPFVLHGTEVYLNAPMMRARRILVPMAAWGLVLGRQDWIDAAYVAILLASVFAGAYFLARLAAEQGRHAAWGLLFLTVPPVIVGADTMTVDGVLAALTAFLVWRTYSGGERGTWLALAAAALVRETGLLLIAAWVLGALLTRRLRQSAIWASAALPFLIWWAYLVHRLPATSPTGIPRWVQSQARIGVLARALDPPHYPLLGGSIEPIVRGLDIFSLVGMASFAVLAVLLVRTAKPASVKAGLAIQAGFLLAMPNLGFWRTPYGYCRPFAPLFVLVLAVSVMAAGRWRQRVALLAVFCVDLRVVAELKTQVQGVLRWLGSS